MWPLIIGVGIVTILTKVFSKNKELSNNKLKEKKLFISFAIEDEIYRNHLVSQAKKDKSPFSFIDMSVKKPWPEDIWKEKCRAKIKKCDGMIVLVSKNSWHSSGTRWEIKCAHEEKVPVIGMQIKKNDKGAILPELKEVKIIDWTWKNIHETINKINIKHNL